MRALARSTRPYKLFDAHRSLPPTWAVELVDLLPLVENGAVPHDVLAQRVPWVGGFHDGEGKLFASIAAGTGVVPVAEYPELEVVRGIGYGRTWFTGDPGWVRGELHVNSMKPLDGGALCLREGTDGEVFEVYPQPGKLVVWEDSTPHSVSALMRVGVRVCLQFLWRFRE